MKKVYYQLIFIQRSPLRIGNGSHELSDSDLMLDGRNLPFIPGTSLAGIIRHDVEAHDFEKKEIIKRLFGAVVKPNQISAETNAIPSAILVGDAVLPQGTSAADAVLGTRDGVGLTEWGTAKKGAKFDFQISESQKDFCSIVEWDGSDEQYQTEILDLIDPVMRGYVSSGMKIGARTTRGYGKFDVHIRKKEFVFPKDLEAWLDFDPYTDKAFDDMEELTGAQNGCETVIDISFAMTGNFSVRVNTAKTEIMEDGSVPDSIPLENHEGNPVIPGTSWAGVFRHHMHALLRDADISECIVGQEKGKEIRRKNELDMLFGMAERPENGRKSRITFSESEVKVKNKQKQKMSVVRTAIDRFTASPRNAALFTSMVYFGGEGKLTISFDNAISNLYKDLLAACICDMHIGLLAVGGETSVGRGIAEITSLKVNEEERIDRMLASLEKNAPLDWLREVADHE